MSCGCLTLANKEEKCPRFPIPAGLLLFQRYHRIIEWNHLGWKHSLRSSSASLYLALPGPPLNPIPEMLLRKGRRVFPWCPEVSPRLISQLDSTPWHDSPANQVSMALQGPECPPRAAGADPSAEESARASWGCSGGCAGSKERSFKMQMSRTTPLFNCRGSSSVDFSKESSAREKHCPGRCWGLNGGLLSVAASSSPPRAGLPGDTGALHVQFLSPKENPSLSLVKPRHSKGPRLPKSC